MPFAMAQWSEKGPATMLAGILVATWIATYILRRYQFHVAHVSKHPGQLPPKYPTLIPYLGIILPLLWNPRDALHQITKYKGRATVGRLTLLPGFDVYFFQDPSVVHQILKQSSNLDMRLLACHLLQRACGMPSKAVTQYLNDDSGVHTNPRPGSTIGEKDRIHRLIHVSDRTALTGSNFLPTFGRFATIFWERMAEKTSDEWTEFSDFKIFIHDTSGFSLIHAIFGPKLLEENPSFMRELATFDGVVPSLLRGLSWAGALKTRNELLWKLKSWARHARKMFVESKIYPDGDGDPFWGSAWTRFRHRHFTQVFDDDAMAANDLAVAWGATGNTLPCTLMAAMHVMRDGELRSRVQDELAAFPNHPLPRNDLRRFLKLPLLNSIHAETTRLYVTHCMPVIPTSGDISVGKWQIPKGSWGFINTTLSHMDKQVWNTKSGLHPVDSFWACRFLKDPNDPESGPALSTARPAVGDSKNFSNSRRSLDRGGVAVTAATDRQHQQVEPFFTTEGLDGSWIPYGSANIQCPGRFLAQGVIAYTAAILARFYDVEFLVESVTLGTDRFGLGVEHPTHPIPFRIRKRPSE